MTNRFDTTQPANRFDSVGASTPSAFDRETFKQGIVHAENKTALYNGQDPYGVVGVTKDLGKYQVSPTTLNQWSGPWLGKTYTPQQFLADPKAQEEFMNQYMNVAERLKLTHEQAAAAWHKGWGELGSGQSREVRDANFLANLSNKVQQAGSYLKEFSNALGRGQTGTAQASTGNALTPTSSTEPQFSITPNPISPIGNTQTSTPMMQTGTAGVDPIAIIRKIAPGVGGTIDAVKQSIQTKSFQPILDYEKSVFQNFKDKNIADPAKMFTTGPDGKPVLNKEEARKVQTLVMGFTGGEDFSASKGLPQKTASELADFFAKQTDEKVITHALQELHFPQDTLPQTARALVQTKTPEEAGMVLKNGVLEGTVVTPTTSLNESIAQKKGIVAGDARATLANAEARTGVTPTVVDPVEALRVKAEAQLGRPVLFTAEEKRLIEGSNSRQRANIHQESELPPSEGTLGKSPGTQQESMGGPDSSADPLSKQQIPYQSKRELPKSLDSATADGTGRILTGTSEGEIRSLEKVAQESLGANQELSARDVSFQKVIDTYATPVQKKVNKIDRWLRTPERVLEKIGLGDEAKFLRTQYEGYVKELPKNIDKVTAWSKRVPEKSNARIFRYLDGQAIDLNAEEQKVALEIKDYLKKWADRLGLPEDKRIANYITHIFDEQLLKKEFDEDLAKIIQDKVPHEVYDPFLQKRLGTLGYEENTWAALDAYTKRATRKFYMDPALDRIANKAESFEVSQWNYVKDYIDKVNMRPSQDEMEIDNWIKSVAGYWFGQRPTMTISRGLRQWVYRGTLGLNVGSALRNLTQGVNTYAELGEKYTLLGYTDLLRNGTKELRDVGVLADNLIQDRTISAVKTTLQKLDKGLFAMFETAEKINRGSAYYGAKAKALAEGKTLPEAVEYAKEIVRKTQFTFGKIDTPILFQEEGFKILAQFQSFTVKQMEFLGGKVAKKEWAGIARYILGSVVMLYTIGKLFGMKKEDIIPSFRFGVPASLKIVGDPAVDFIRGNKDNYGNPMTAKKYIKQGANDLLMFVPGGNQLKKTLQGVAAVEQGKSTTSNGKTQYKIPKTTGNLIRAGLFGKNNLPQAQTYYNKPAKKKTAGNRF